MPFFHKTDQGIPATVFPDKFETLKDVYRIDIADAYIYLNPTDPDYQDFCRGRL
jgi:hypothetical protein